MWNSPSLYQTLLLLQALASTAASLATRDSVTRSIWGSDHHPSGSNANCKCFPGDQCWPSASDWAGLNSTVQGRLVASIPLAAPCHHDEYAAYNEAECAALKNTWLYPETHYQSPSSPMAAWFANNSCNPFLDQSAPCRNLAYVQYAVKAANVADYQATLAFAAKHNIRLVIRNTGHDYFGKSVGAGSLALWTHYLKDTEVIKSYKSRAYSGPAMKLGAGVQGFEAFAAADKAGLAVVGGDCETVGVPGGYSQGGGLGPLSSYAGLGADQALEWEVVLASGHHIVATPHSHSDLYWALSGGGGGTYAAVVSMTVRAYPTMKVATASLSFGTVTNSTTAFVNVVKTFLLSLPAFADAGAWASFYITGGQFQLVPAFGPNISGRKLQSLLHPTISALNKAGISYQYKPQTFPSYLSAYNATVGLVNVTDANLGGRLIPRTNFETKSSVDSLMDAFQVILDNAGVVSGIVSTQTQFPRNVHNSVNPAFRKSLVDIVIGLLYNHTDYEANAVIQKDITDKYQPLLERLTPGGGSYLNEGDINQPNWQQAFYGDNYDKLYLLKQFYDPNGLFYGLKSVGSEDWEYRMRTDGRLCYIGDQRW